MNVLSATSCIFTLLLAGVFPSEPGDKITLSKIFAVCFNFSGVLLVSYADIKDQALTLNESTNMPVGVVWALSGAFFYSVYIVLLRRKVQVRYTGHASYLVKTILDGILLVLMNPYFEFVMTILE